jgi:hypothetical protein
LSPGSPSLSGSADDLVVVTGALVVVTGYVGAPPEPPGPPVEVETGVAFAGTATSLMLPPLTGSSAINAFLIKKDALEILEEVVVPPAVPETVVLPVPVETLVPAREAEDPGVVVPAAVLSHWLMLA